MDTFYSITFWISAIFAIVLLIGFILYIKRIRKEKKKLTYAFGSLAVLVGLVIIPYLVVQTFDRHGYSEWLYMGGEENSLSYTVEEDERYGDSLNYDKHFTKVMAFRVWMDRELVFINKSKEEYYNCPKSLQIKKKYLAYQESSDSLVRDVGHLFYALHMANLDAFAAKNQRHLDKITNKEMPFFHYVQGLNHKVRRSWSYRDRSEEQFLLSIQKNECNEYSYEGLSELYWLFGDEEKLSELAYDSSTSEMVPRWIRRQVYFMDFNWGHYWSMMFDYEIHQWGLINASAAAILLMMWIIFLRKLDIYEPEKWKHVIATFLMSVVSMQLLYPIHDFQWGILEYFRPNNPFQDFGYMIAHIGFVEEFVKILPLLIMIRFTKAVNEPFDYILYACVGALGFAFVENVYYFGNPFNISYRGFICYLAHIAWSATIGYGLMLAKYRGYNSILMFVIFFLIASFFHGFYDFWLMDWWAIQYQWVSMIMVIVSIQLLVYYSNNTLNISNFYDEKIELNKEKIKFYGLLLCIAVLMTGYLTIGFLYGPRFAKEYLLKHSVELSFFFFFFILSLSAMKEVRGYLRPLTAPLQGLFKEKKLKDLSGNQLILSISKKHSLNEEILSKKLDLQQTVTLIKRFVVDDNLKGYCVQLSHPLKSVDGEPDQIILIPHWEKMEFDSKQRVLTNVYLFHDEGIFQKPLIQESDLTFVGKVFSEKIKD